MGKPKDVLDMPVTITRPVREMLIVTDDHGGYEGATCFACGKSGWLIHLIEKRLKHDVNCPVARVLFNELL